MSILFNGHVLDRESEKLLSSEGYNFGYGVFETIKLQGAKMIFFDKHIKRMNSGLGLIDINCDVDIEELRQDAQRLVEENRISDGALKILVSKRGDSSDLIISTRESVYHEDIYKRGFSLCLSNMRRNPKSMIPYIKSLNYMENIIERNEAKRRGYDDCLFLNTNNSIAETSISNIFLVEGNKIKTPSIDTGILDGIIRSEVIDIAREKELILEEGEFDLEEVIASEEVFLTNSLMGVMPVASIEDKFYNLNKNKITRSIRSRYEEIIGME